MLFGRNRWIGVKNTFKLRLLRGIDDLVQRLGNIKGNNLPIVN